MNLLIRLSDEHYLILIEDYNVYPISTQKIIDELTNLDYWTELKFSTIDHLVYKLGLRNHSPLTIQKIFKNENIKH